MRWAVLPVVAALAAPIAAAQTPPSQGFPFPGQPFPFPGQQRAAPPANPPAAAPVPAPSPQPAPQPASPPAIDSWLARGGVDLIALDKVTARPTQLTARVGQDVRYGALTIVVRSCIVRPPGVSPDAAAFLEITDSRPGVAPFRGWMLMSTPSVSIYEHPVYDIRVAGCRL